MRIDPHVHFRDGLESYKETIEHGLSVAENQGIDIVFDMPNTYNPILTISDVKKRIKQVPRKKRKNYCLFIGATKHENQLREAVKAVRQKKAVGIKMFAGKSIGNLEVSGTYNQRKVYSTLYSLKYKGIIAVHCEKEIFLNQNRFDPAIPYTHCLARPKKAEIESVKDQIRLALDTGFGGTLHICHVSCKETIDLIKEYRSELRITCGVTPHHVMWDDSFLLKENGLLYKTNPPLRKKADVISLREYLKDGTIDWIETDHAPHSIGEKLHTKFLSGYPSMYVYNYFIKNFLPSTVHLSYKQIKDLTFNNIVKNFKLPS